jgi:hypothetical protein
MARDILACADKGERAEVQLELAALTNLTVTVPAFRTPRYSTEKARWHYDQRPSGLKINT